LKFLFCFSMYISKKALRQQFDPRMYPRETYLLCKLEWNGSQNFWRHWVRNEDSKCDSRHDSRHDFTPRHAERYFLEEIFEPRSYNFCNITWYLSWSPCPGCCSMIQDFLEDMPNVNIDIRIARLYHRNLARTSGALRELASLQGFNYLASVSPDYINCWETFIQPGVNYDFSTVNFQSAIRMNRLQLADILQVSTL
ncbi:ABEC1 enzyme, partial [Regulus satrapa]|nr:ABEC1 enzyme [Regulus satrapa]